MSLLNRLERRFGHQAIPHLSLYLVVGQVLVWSLAYFQLFEVERILLIPAAVLQGEVWRLFTFLLLPPSSHLVFIAFVWYMFYLMGTALETYWGVFRFNLFLLLGWALTVGVSFLFPTMGMTNIFFTGSIFLAFAFLNPDFEMLIFFILPVKIKWLALIQWLGYGYFMIVGPWPVRLAVLAAVGNFLVFFSGDIVQRIRTGKRRMDYQAKQAAARDDDEPRHRCVTCGKTDRTHPQEEFRYSDDDQCYCREHRPSANKPA